MSRPIAYNASGPLSGSIRGGNVNYTVDSGNRDYTTFASKKWVPSADGAAPIVFVTDSYTQGFELNPSLAVPLFYSCNGTGSAAIIYTANRIPGSPGNYSDANVALNDLITARGYFILESNDPYQGDYQSGNLLTLDASKMSSYPQVGTNWLDLSGNDFDFSLQNGPTFNSNGWFGMDGGDDSIYLPGNSTLKSTNTLVMWMRTTDTTGLFLSGQPPYTAGNYYIGAYYPSQGFYNDNAGSPSYFLDTLATSNPATPVNYLDGRFHMWEAKGLNFATWTTNWNFLAYGGGYQIAGDVAKIKMFDSYLTAAQSKQLYFGAPIVTDGLVFAVDANNIVSYPKSGTTTYSLTGSLTGTLTNGVGYLPNNGGTWNFDGTDDFILVPNGYSTVMQGNDYWTVSVWVNANDLSNAPVLISPGAGQLAYSDLYLEIAPNNIYMAASGGPLVASITLSTNTWYHITWVKDGPTTGYIYLNGVRLNTTGTIGAMANTAADFRIGAFKLGSYYLNGKMPSVLMYNKALTASEIQQNYQAEQYRFEGPSGLVTNGMVMYLDASNLDSYPATGNTWYDLTGNSNNATKNGNAANPTWNAGGYFTFAASDGSTGVNNIFTVANSATLSNLTDITVQFICAMETKTPVGNDYDWMCIVTKGEEGGNQKPGTSVHQIVGNRYYHIETPGGVNSAADLFTNADYTGNKWNMFQTRVSNAGGTQGWLNGTQVATAGNTTTGNTSTLYIGSNGFFELFKGKLGVVCIYNRALSDAELVQNYNYFKGRFGL